MIIKREEHIYLSDKDRKLWDDFFDLLQEIANKTETSKVVTLIEGITNKLLDLSDFME